MQTILARRHVEGGGRSKCQFGMSLHRPPSNRAVVSVLSEDKHDLRGQLWRRRRKRGSNEQAIVRIGGRESQRASSRPEEERPRPSCQTRSTAREKEGPPLSASAVCGSCVGMPVKGVNFRHSTPRYTLSISGLFIHEDGTSRVQAIKDAF